MIKLHCGIRCGRFSERVMVEEKIRNNPILLYVVIASCALMICLIVLSLNLLGDGLRDAFDPKLKR